MHFNILTFFTVSTVSEKKKNQEGEDEGNIPLFNEILRGNCLPHANENLALQANSKTMANPTNSISNMSIPPHLAQGQR